MHDDAAHRITLLAGALVYAWQQPATTNMTLNSARNDTSGQCGLDVMKSSFAK